MPRPTASHQHPDLHERAAPGQADGALPGGNASDQWLGLHLQRLYGDVIDEPVPDRLISILWRPHGQSLDEPGGPT